MGPPCPRRSPPFPTSDLRLRTRWPKAIRRRPAGVALAPIRGSSWASQATGKQFTISGMTIDRIVQGKVVEEREEWDALGLFQQLGAVPPLAKAKAKAAA